jgi:hypothetical protein
VTSPAAGAEGAGQVTGDAVQPDGGSSAKGQGSGSQGAGQQGGQTNGHPAWDQYLKDIPAGLHAAVTPAFQKWDSDMNAKLSQVQQQYAPWQSVIDGGHTPETVSGALELAQAFQQDPVGVIGELVQWASQNGHDLSALGGEQGDSGQGEGELGPSEEDDALPDWAQEMKQSWQQQSELLDLLAQKTIADGEQAQQEAAVDELESQLTPLLQQAGINHQGEDADNDALDFVFAQLMNGATPEQAVQKWGAFRQAVVGQQASASAPKVLGAGGGLPTQQVDPNTPLSQKDRRALAVESAKRMMAGGAGG